MDGRMFEGLAEGIITLLIIVAITLPFAIWKWIEILIWLFSHLSWAN